MNSFFLGNVVYDLFDCGVANLLEVETLRHGTHFFNYLAIRWQGGAPSHGGKADGSTNGFCNDDTRNYFFVFKQREYCCKTEVDFSFKKLSFQNILHIISIDKDIGSRLLSKIHTCLSGYNFVNSKLSVRIIALVLGIFSGVLNLVFTPTLRFRFAHIESSRLINDPMYDGRAYLTEHLIEPWRIGLLGSVRTGVNLDWFSRVKAAPLTFLLGAAQLISAIAIMSLCIAPIVANPSLLIPGLAGALLS